MLVLPKVYDHDFETFSEGTIVPQGIYYIAHNTVYLSIGTSQDSSEFVCDNIERVWNSHLRQLYPNASMIVILCDGGGSNSCRHRIVKQDFMDLADRIEMKILVMYYPPGGRPSQRTHNQRRNKAIRPHADVQDTGATAMYHLSDAQTEYPIRDRLSFRDFLGLASGDRVPDQNTLWLLRENLTKRQLFESLFDRFYQFLEEKRLIMNEG